MGSKRGDISEIYHAKVTILTMSRIYFQGERGRTRMFTLRVIGYTKTN